MLGGDVNSEGYITDCTSKIDQSNNISHTINMEKQKQLEAKREADELFLPREGKKLMKEYEKLLETMYIIKESTLRRKITREIQPLMNAKGYSFVKAATISIRRTTECISL
jgi:Skp family chaperone for outer membrane proteins